MDEEEKEDSNQNGSKLFSTSYLLSFEEIVFTYDPKRTFI